MTTQVVRQIVSSIHTELDAWRFFRHGLEDLDDRDYRKFERDLRRAVRLGLTSEQEEHVRKSRTKP